MELYIPNLPLPRSRLRKYSLYQILSITMPEERVLWKVSHQQFSTRPRSDTCYLGSQVTAQNKSQASPSQRGPQKCHPHFYFNCLRENLTYLANSINDCAVPEAFSFTLEFMRTKHQLQLSKCT